MGYTFMREAYMKQGHIHISANGVAGCVARLVCANIVVHLSGCWGLIDACEAGDQTLRFRA
jgi:hypothetical protein